MITNSQRALLVDIGNTNLKWCWLVGGDISTIQSVSHRQQPVATLACSCWAEESKPSDVLVANVGDPGLGEGLGSWMQSRWNIQPLFLISQERAYGVTNGYHIPRQLGVDRWLTLIAVHNQFASPVCVVDCGTAITIDIITSKGQHLGGLILPGFDMMRGALLDRTHIPRVSSSKATPLLGLDTESAVASAGFHSAAALVERVFAVISKQLGESPVLVLTGSDAPQLRAVLGIPSQIKPDLVMSGLALIASGQTR